VAVDVADFHETTHKTLNSDRVFGKKQAGIHPELHETQACIALLVRIAGVKTASVSPEVGRGEIGKRLSDNALALLKHSTVV